MLIRSHSGIRGARFHDSAGVSLLELLMIGALITLLVVGLFSLNSFSIRTVRASKETAAANQILHERLEQLRQGTWKNVTDVNYTRSVLGTEPGSASALPDLSETITISAYPAVSPPPTPIRVTRSAGGSVTTVSSNATLRQRPMVRADVTATWVTERNGANSSRTISTVIANGGIIK